MITTEGRAHIKRYLAGYVPVIGGAIAFGIGAVGESPGDVNLQFETARAQVTQVYYDFALNKVMFKATVPDEYVGSIYEHALYSSLEDTNNAVFGSKSVSTFDSNAELWVDSTTLAGEAYSTLARVGGDSLAHSPLASATKTSALQGLNADFSGYSANDVVSVAFNVSNANTASVYVRFLTDTANYYTFSTTSTSAGYKIIDFPKSAATVTGSPDWSTISQIWVSTTSNSSGASSVTWDGIRWKDTDTRNLDYILVARKVLASPVVKVAGQSYDIEFGLDVTV